MKTNIQKRFENLTTRLIRKSREASRYSFETPVRSFATGTRGVQLGSYLRYAVNVERKL